MCTVSGLRRRSCPVADASTAHLLVEYINFFFPSTAFSTTTTSSLINEVTNALAHVTTPQCLAPLTRRVLHVPHRFRHDVVAVFTPLFVWAQRGARDHFSTPRQVLRSELGQRGFSVSRLRTHDEGCGARIRARICISRFTLTFCTGTGTYPLAAITTYPAPLILDFVLQLLFCLSVSFSTSISINPPHRTHQPALVVPWAQQF